MYCETVRDVVLLGNEAVAYGALESGVRFASAYPGTPSTEIIETLAKLVRKYNLDVHVEWSVNEKVAFEAAYGAAIAGVNSIVAMKHVGLNVALDPFTTSAYTGVEASLVVVSADDPKSFSIWLLYLEAKSSICLAFGLSYSASRFASSIKGVIELYPSINFC